MKRILFISYSGPVPAIDGKRQRTYALIEALTSRYEVDYLILDNQQDYQSALQSKFSSSTRFFFFSKPESRSTRILHSLGLIFIPSPFLSQQINQLCVERKYLFAFSRYIQPVLYLPKSLPVVADIDDDLEENYKNRIANAKSWIRKWRLYQVLWLNQGIYRRLLGRLVDGFTVKAETGRDSMKLLPNLPFQILQKGPVEFVSTQAAKILFVGKLTYQPNLSGIKWFIREVLPLVLKENPEVCLTLVSNATVSDHELVEVIAANPSIQLLINVDDLDHVYQSHSICIAPIWEGAGSNIKVAESLLMGRPVVTTPIGSRGFEKAKGTSFLKEASTCQKFCEQIIDLLSKKEKLLQAQQEAFEFGGEEFSLNRWTTQFLTDLEHVR